MLVSDSTLFHYFIDNAENKPVLQNLLFNLSEGVAFDTAIPEDANLQ